jgi:hypothetical protein
MLDVLVRAVVLSALPGLAEHPPPEPEDLVLQDPALVGQDDQLGFNLAAEGAHVLLVQPAAAQARRPERDARDQLGREPHIDHDGGSELMWPPWIHAVALPGDTKRDIAVRSRFTIARLGPHVSNLHNAT